MLLGELLVRERGPEVGVVRPDERHGLVPGGGREAAATRPPAAPRRETRRTRRHERVVEAADLALTQPQQLRGAAPREAPLGDLRHDL
jgi:hypothetical protein